MTVAYGNANGHTFKHWPYLNVELAHAIRAEAAVIDGEISLHEAFHVPLENFLSR